MRSSLPGVIITSSSSGNSSAFLACCCGFAVLPYGCLLVVRLSGKFGETIENFLLKRSISERILRIRNKLIQSVRRQVGWPNSTIQADGENIH